jgi:hypothetical protein
MPGPARGTQEKLAAFGLTVVHVSSTLIAFAALVGGLFALAAYPIVGVLLTLGGMALLLYGTAGLCGAQERFKK